MGFKQLPYHFCRELYYSLDAPLNNFQKVPSITPALIYRPHRTLQSTIS